MSAPSTPDWCKQLTGLSAIPGTLNVTRTQPFELGLSDYVRLADHGLQFDPGAVGIDFEGEQGFHHGLVLVTGQHPASLIMFNWTPDPTIWAELVSPHHRRNTVALRDRDAIELTLVKYCVPERDKARCDLSASIAVARHMASFREVVCCWVERTTPR